jgi:paraquat-inducible protein A
MNAERRKTLLQTNPQPGRIVVLMLVVSMALFLAGIFRPVTAVTKLWVFENQISVVSGLITLWRELELFLFLILLVFTVIFPFVKISSLLVLWLKPGLTLDQAQSLFHFVSQLGKWSMLDVFIVAILVLTVKSGGVASIRIQDGLFLFFCSVMLTQFGAMWTGRVASRLVKEPS